MCFTCYWSGENSLTLTRQKSPDLCNYLYIWHCELFSGWTNFLDFTLAHTTQMIEVLPNPASFVFAPCTHCVVWCCAFTAFSIDSVTFGTVGLSRLMYFLNPVGNPTKQRTHLSNAKTKPPNVARIMPWMDGNTTGSLLGVWSLTASQSVALLD